MKIREKTIVKLVLWLIEFLGRDVNGFYSHNLKEVMADLWKEEER